MIEFSPERRRLLGGLLAVGGALLLRNVPEAKAAPQIIPKEYTPGRGKQSFPWIPVSIAREEEVATSLEAGGAIEYYDGVDISLNGSNSLASRNGEYTRLVLRRHFDQGLRSRELNPDWSGHCYGASSASWECPIIEGSINIAGFEIPALQRMQLASWYYSAMRYDEWSSINDEVIAEIEDEHFAKGEGIGCNHTPEYGQEWWGTLIEVRSKGKEWILRDFRRWRRGDETLPPLDPHSLTSARIFHYDGPHPGKENDFYYLNRQVLGVIIGTHQLV